MPRRVPLVLLCAAFLFAFPDAARAQKSVSLSHLGKARQILATLTPGDRDGSDEMSETVAGDPQKLPYTVLLPLHVRLALAQKRAGDSAGAKTTLARGLAFCVVSGKPDPARVELLARHGLRAGFYAEIRAFLTQYDSRRACGPLVAEYEAGVLRNRSLAQATLLAVLFSPQSDTQKLTQCLEIAVRYDLPDARTKARRLLAPLVKNFVKQRQAWAYYLGVPGLDADDIESGLYDVPESPDDYKTAEMASAQVPIGEKAVGKLLLRRPEASATVDAIGKDDGFPGELVTLLSRPRFNRLAHRVGLREPVRDAIFELNQDNRLPPQTLLELWTLWEPLRQDRATDTLDLQIHTLAGDALLALPPSAPRMALARRLAALLHKRVARENALTAKNAHWAAREKTERAQRRAEYLAALAPFEPAFVEKQLPGLSPRFQLIVLAGLSRVYEKAR